MTPNFFWCELWELLVSLQELRTKKKSPLSTKNKLPKDNNSNLEEGPLNFWKPPPTPKPTLLPLASPHSQGSEYWIVACSSVKRNDILLHCRLHTFERKYFIKATILTFSEDPYRLHSELNEGSNHWYLHSCGKLLITARILIALREQLLTFFFWSVGHSL